MLLFDVTLLGWMLLQGSSPTPGKNFGTGRESGALGDSLVKTTGMLVYSLSVFRTEY